MKRAKMIPTAQSLRDSLMHVIKGFEARAQAGDATAASTAKALRAARCADLAARAQKPDTAPFARCSSCGDMVAETHEPRRPGGTARHHSAPGVLCPGSDLPLAAHAEIRAAARAPRASLFGLFGPVQEGIA